MELRRIGFKKEEIGSIKDTDDVMNWPVVYVLNGGKEVYVGETCDIKTRLGQHLANPTRQKMIQAHIVYDERLNKSATLDIEQSLIQLYYSEEKIVLQNRNGGQSTEHNYYNRPKYRKCIPKIWELLIENGLAQTPIKDLLNSALFKYSPYTSLTKEQLMIKNKVLSDVIESIKLDKNSIYVINGGAGTGKTLVALNILNALIKTEDLFLEEVNLDHDKIQIDQITCSLANPKTKNPLKVGLVVPMYSLRSTLQRVVKKAGITKNTVINPYEMVSKAKIAPYDVLIVDEAHRLTSRKGAKQNIKLFSELSEQLGLDANACSQLDWIKKCSKCCILFYDEGQTINSYDITPEQFSNSVGDCNQYELNTQMRCKGGRPFIDYVSEILQCRKPDRQQSFENGFELGLFEHVDDLVRFIRNRDQKEGLCRVVAGYSWDWVTRDNDSIDYDIEIEGHRYKWNMTGKEWIISEDATRTIGCVHTTQGYDLNYVGLIFGREIDFDPKTNEIIIHPNLFSDEGVKRGSTPEMLKTHILNAYRVMMTRGINGCFVYAYNPSLREYLKQFMDVVNFEPKD